jgi:hypothetical protein
MIAQNIAVPLDWRARLECTAIVSAGYRVPVVCPKGSGDPAYRVIDKVEPVARAAGGQKLARCHCPTSHHERPRGRTRSRTTPRTNTLLGCGAARLRGVKAMLSGMGAGDLSGGYARWAKRFRC